MKMFLRFLRCEFGSAGLGLLGIGMCWQRNTAPIDITDDLLLEDGDFILLETGDKILLE